MTINERRSHRRFTPYKEIFLIHGDEELEIGFIFDISKTGVRLAVESLYTSQLGDKFQFRIRSSKYIDGNKVDITVKRIWTSQKVFDGFQEVGCQYDNLNLSNQKKIESLLKMYEALEEFNKS